MVCNPYLHVLISLEENVGALRVLQWLLLVSKMSCMIYGYNPFNIWYISVASICRFLWWTVTDLSLERSFSHDEIYDHMIFSWNLFILRFICLPWNIQISGHYANCEEINGFMVVLIFFWGMYVDSLAKACRFWLTLWTIFKDDFQMLIYGL